MSSSANLWHFDIFILGLFYFIFLLQWRAETKKNKYKNILMNNC